MSPVAELIVNTLVAYVAIPRGGLIASSQDAKHKGHLFYNAYRKRFTRIKSAKVELGVLEENPTRMPNI